MTPIVGPERRVGQAEYVRLAFEVGPRYSFNSTDQYAWSRNSFHEA